MQDGTMTMQPITGGITNKLFKVCFQGQSVLIRVYGGGEMIDRVAETKSFVLLSEAGLGPACHGTFQNGRLEHFFEGFRTLTYHHLSVRVISAHTHTHTHTHTHAHMPSLALSHMDMYTRMG